MTGARPVTGASKPTVQVPEPVSQAPQRDSTPVDTGSGWQRMSEFSPQVGSTPSALRFPDGKVATTANWADFIVGIVEWLRANGSLTEHELPIRFGDQTQNVVSATPPSSSGFGGSGAYRQVGEWFIRTSYTGGQHARNAERLIKHTGLNPADFAVRLAE